MMTLTVEERRVTFNVLRKPPAVHGLGALDLMLPNTATTQQLMKAWIVMGEGEKDYSALILTLETLAGEKS